MKEESRNNKKYGTLHIVSTPIGNPDDISLRALNILKISDYVVCEEAKIGARILHHYNISKELLILNEQNENSGSDEIIKMLLSGRNISLISDCGTPVFADPGRSLINTAIQLDVPVIVVPGASSIMTALVRSGFNIDQFVYAGFLSRKNEDRLRQLKKLSLERRTIIILDTPYRLMPMLEAAAKIMPDRNAYRGCNLTMPFETHHYGTLSEIYVKFKELFFKGEFVLILDKYIKRFGFEDEASDLKATEAESQLDIEPPKIPAEHSTPEPGHKPPRTDFKPAKKRIKTSSSYREGKTGNQRDRTGERFKGKTEHSYTHGTKFSDNPKRKWSDSPDREAKTGNQRERTGEKYKGKTEHSSTHGTKFSDNPKRKWSDSPDKAYKSSTKSKWKSGDSSERFNLSGTARNNTGKKRKFNVNPKDRNKGRGTSK